MWRPILISIKIALKWNLSNKNAHTFVYCELSITFEKKSMKNIVKINE